MFIVWLLVPYFQIFRCLDHTVLVSVLYLELGSAVMIYFHVHKFVTVNGLKNSHFYYRLEDPCKYIYFRSLEAVLRLLSRSDAEVIFTVYT